MATASVAFARKCPARISGQGESGGGSSTGVRGYTKDFSAMAKMAQLTVQEMIKVGGVCDWTLGNRFDFDSHALRSIEFSTPASGEKSVEQS